MTDEHDKDHIDIPDVFAELHFAAAVMIAACVAITGGVAFALWVGVL